MMSETQELSQRRQPAVPKPETVTDSIGRVLTYQKLDALAEMDLVEAAGLLADNRAWMLRATLASCVKEIDGMPCPPIKNRETIRAQVKLVGAEGIAAVVSTLAPEEQAVAASDAETAATAKN